MIDHTAIIGASNGQPVAIDVERLVGGHAAIIANSGGGKSGLIRRILEQTHGAIQHIIIDPEDEFYTLRERYDYVIAGGDDGDIPVTVEGAKALALGALQHGFSLIVQLNDLGAAAGDFVAAFLNAMIHAPRDLWHPALVVIDEAQRFAPSGGTETPAARAVKALTAQGRKRGFTAVLASQRIAKIDANVRGDINNWMLGRVGQALDRNAMADQLGFSAREGRERLAGIADRHFWGFGPAVAAEPVLFRVADVETTPVRPGQAKVLTPPPAGALADILAGLVVEAPKVENHAETCVDAHVSGQGDRIAALQARVHELEAERDNWIVEQAFGQQQLEALVNENKAIREIAQRFADAAADLAVIRPALEDMDGRPTPAAAPEIVHQPAPAREKPAPPRPRAAATGGSITGPQQRILDALAWWGAFGIDQPTNEQIGFVAGYSPGSGNFNNLRGQLRAAGLIAYPSGGRASLTESGRGVARQPDTAPTRGAFHAAVRAKLKAPQLRLLDPALGAYPKSLSTDDLAAVSGYSAGSGNFNNLRGSLRTLDLIVYPQPGYVRASDWLFP